MYDLRVNECSVGEERRERGEEMDGTRRDYMFLYTGERCMREIGGRITGWGLDSVEQGTDTSPFVVQG